MKDALPFLVANVMILGQPIFDLPWALHWEKVMKAERNQLVGPAEWVSRISSFFTSAALTIYGTSLLATADPMTEDQRVALVTSIVVVFLLSVGLYLYEATCGIHERRPRLKYWGFLHVYLFVLNCVGIWLAFAI